MARQSHMTDEIRKRNYEAHKQRMRERSRRETATGRNIYPIPQVQNPEAKAKARESFRFFCEYYFPDLFSLAWSKDHLKAIAKIEHAVKHGGKFAIAMPRGSGKTTLCEIACIWAALYGFHRFILLVGAESTMAGGMFESIKSEIQENERLYADFPEVCYPVEEIGGISNRASGQHCNGRRTQIKWNSSLLVFPDVTLDGLPESDLHPSSGVVVKYSGITGGIRGMKHKRNGKNERPTLVLVDDPQTDESARSPSQVADRLKLIVQTISNLAGAGQSCSVLVPCTVIVRNDVAEQLLNRKKHPEYQGERFKALEKWPSNMELWNRYAEMRAKDLQEDGDGSVATEFYRAHRKEMDAGAEVAWPERFNNDEISGLQFCMNKYFEDEASFASEFQQEPLVSDVFDDQLTPGHIVDKLNGRKRFSVPLQASTLTAFIDVQKEALYYVVCAWSRQFDGFLIDYGTFPKQGRRRFEAKTLDSKLEDMFPGMGMEGRIRRALDLLTTDILGREYEREDGQNPSYTERYYVEGTSSSAVATETGRALMVHKYGSPPTYNGLPLLTTRTEPLRGVAAWRFEAVFQPLEVQTEEVAESNYSFSSTSGTANVKYSLETVAAATIDGRPVRNFYNGINRNDAGGYDGVDLFVPTPEFSIKQSHPMGWFTRSSRVLVSTLVGCINNAPFDGYAPGELMFKGIDATTARYTDATGAYRWYWQATYHFAASPNTFIPFGGQDVPKRGWDYSWMLVEKWENPETGDEESRPVQLNIERVYRTMDFSALCLKLPQ